MSQEREGIGPHAMWGCTPAQDLLRDSPLKGQANILICQPGDIGHVLRTIGTRRGHPQHTIHLYIWERQIEVLARHLLLLQVAQDWELPIRQRANVFLEIFGNCLVQDRTSRYIARLGKELVGMLFSTEDVPDILDLSLLKNRERDQLEEVFKSWRCDVPCNVTALRDARLRNFFGVRYDHRKNLVDWDYTNRLKQVASIIHHTQYRSWRLEGIAYEFGDQVYDKPNRTMVSYAEGMMVKGEHRGLKKEMRGFWLDIRVGPFITFGVDCDRPNPFAEELFNVLNKGTGTEQHRHNTAEVAVYSTISYLWGLETRGHYAMTKVSPASGDSVNLKGHARDPSPAEDQSSSRISEQSRHATDDRTDVIRQEQALERAQCIVETFDGVKVFLLSGDLDRHLSKPRFKHLFDRVHMSLTAVDAAGSACINEALADEAVVTMDTGRYMIPFNKDQQRNFVERTCSLASGRGWKPLFGSQRSSEGSATPANDAALNMDSVGFSFTRKPVFG
ncbi:unnamed protein product [Ectocarpus sp. 6 AP-2014]